MGKSMYSLIRPASLRHISSTEVLEAAMFIRSPDLAHQKEKKKEKQILCKTERKEEVIKKRRKRERNLKCMSSSTAYSYVWYLFTEVSGTVTLSWPPRRALRRRTILSFEIAQSVQISVWIGRQGCDSRQDTNTFRHLFRPGSRVHPVSFIVCTNPRFFPHW